MLRILTPVIAAVVVLGCLASCATEPKGPSAAIATAVADPGRPDADKQRDPLRKPAEDLAFAGVKPGDKIGELLPGRGYFTRIFAKIVGPKGHVYAILPQQILTQRPQLADAAKAIAADPAYGNVSVAGEYLAKFSAPEPLDLVWTSDNYHDLKIATGAAALDTVAMDKAIFAALKPGGIYIVLDHAAAPGSGTRDVGTLHRIDPAVVKQEVTSAGFELVAESDLLKNPADDHTAKVFDADIRGKTDQFIFKFRKPKK
jgi:predicted methyltransferase